LIYQRLIYHNPAGTWRTRGLGTYRAGAGPQRLRPGISAQTSSCAGTVTRNVPRLGSGRGGGSVLMALEQAAIDAGGAGGIIEHEVPHPVTVLPRGRVLEGLIVQVMSDHLDSPFVLEDLGRACRFDCPARMHGDRRCAAAFDALRQHIGEGALIVLAE